MKVCVNCKSSFDEYVADAGFCSLECFDEFAKWDTPEKPKGQKCGWAAGCANDAEWYISPIKQWTCHIHGLLYP